jgi:biotin synthase-related radical SAM superfamily protein
MNAKTKPNIAFESPDHVRLSLAAAMTLGYKKGLFYRNAKLHCINLLLTYRKGCAARCAYCGLSNSRPGVYERKSFIRVTWPTYPLDDIIGRISQRHDHIKRICVSMITHKCAVRDSKEICSRLRTALDIPVSVLVSPTILKDSDMASLKEAGADRIGVAVDLATPTLFTKYRGLGVSGPHRWETYWDCLSLALRLFGEGRAGPHLIVGMGETEKEMCDAIQRARDIGGRTHLFSFFPEENSAMADHPVPPLDQYRRMQLTRYLIDNRLSRTDRFVFSAWGRVLEFGLLRADLDDIIESGTPFRTSGCEGYDGEVACNRPFANSRPGPEMRNYPFPPEEGDISRIREQIGLSRDLLR